MSNRINIGTLDSALAFHRDFRGSRDPKILRDASRAAMHLNLCKRYDEAVTLWKLIAESKQEILGVDHRETLSAQHNLAWTLVLEGNGEQAAKLANHVVTRCHATFGSADELTAEAQKCLYMALDMLGLKDQILAKVPDVNPEDAHNVALSIEGLGLVGAVNWPESNDDEFRELSSPVWQQHLREVGLVYLERLNGDAGADEIGGARFVAMNLNMCGLSAEALPLWESAARCLQQLSDQLHPERDAYALQGCRVNAAWCLYRVGRVAEAIDLSRKAAVVCEQEFGAEDESTLSAKHCLVTALLAAGRTDESQDAWLADAPLWKSYYWLYVVGQYWVPTALECTSSGKIEELMS